MTSPMRDDNDSDEALRRITPKTRQELIDRLDEGRRQLDEGEYVEFDEEGLHQYFQGLIQRASRQREKHS